MPRNRQTKIPNSNNNPDIYQQENKYIHTMKYYSAVKYMNYKLHMIINFKKNTKNKSKSQKMQNANAECYHFYKALKKKSKIK